MKFMSIFIMGIVFLLLCVININVQGKEPDKSPKSKTISSTNTPTVNQKYQNTIERYKEILQQKVPQRVVEEDNDIRQISSILRVGKKIFTNNEWEQRTSDKEKLEYLQGRLEAKARFLEKAARMSEEGQCKLEVMQKYMTTIDTHSMANNPKLLLDACEIRFSPEEQFYRELYRAFSERQRSISQASLEFQKDITQYAISRGITIDTSAISKLKDARERGIRDMGGMTWEEYKTRKFFSDIFMMCAQMNEEAKKGNISDPISAAAMMTKIVAESVEKSMK